MIIKGAKVYTEEGTFADIVVIDRNLFTVDPSEIISANVWQTVMDGSIIYER